MRAVSRCSLVVGFERKYFHSLSRHAAHYPKSSGHMLLWLACSFVTPPPPKSHRGSNLLRVAVSSGDKTTQILSNFYPKREWIPKRAVRQERAKISMSRRILPGKTAVSLFTKRPTTSPSHRRPPIPLPSWLYVYTRNPKRQQRGPTVLSSPGCCEHINKKQKTNMAKIRSAARDLAAPSRAKKHIKSKFNDRAYVQLLLPLHSWCSSHIVSAASPNPLGVHRL